MNDTLTSNKATLTMKICEEGCSCEPAKTNVCYICLNENKFIVPGVGDAGDRMFGTK